MSFRNWNPPHRLDITESRLEQAYKDRLEKTTASADSTDPIVVQVGLSILWLEDSC